MILEGVKANRTEDEMLRKVLLEWATKIMAQEKAQPLHSAIAALHTQTKSQPTPARIHIWTD
jgi:hypothetical protein